MNENNTIVPDEIILPGNDCVDTRNKDIPLARIIELRRKNLSLQQIADICKCSKQNIHRRLQDCEEFEDFKRDKAICYEVLQHKIIDSIDSESIKKTPMASRVTAIAILEDKIRLLRGEATERIDTFAVTASLEELRKRKAELLARIEAESEGAITDTNKQKQTKNS